MSATALHREGFRYDIQGLRAVAVVLVVLDHAFKLPAGGFVGVDVFYVISGFLITGLLLRELDQTGSVSLRAFYARRVRRIVPAAALVLAVTTIGAWIVWFSPRALQVTLDALSALLFVSNWHFAELGTDYLEAEGPVSPVQHYWSLSIEEQFYAVWPLLLFALFVLLKGRRRALASVILAAIALGLVIAAYRTASDPNAAYFETWGRAWALFLGALIACIGSGPRRIGTREITLWARRLVSLIGLALIIGSALVLTPESRVPFPGVVPAVVGSALVIWAGAPTARRGLLGNRVSQWLGDVSYSLYLWHFPVLIFAAAVFGDSVWVAVAALPVMLVLSELSRRYVERAVMDSGFLKRAAKSQNARRFVPRDVLFGIGALVLIGALSVAQLKGPAWLRSGSELASRIGTEHIEPRESASDAKTRADDVRAALDETTWPEGPASDLEVLSLAQQGEAMLRAAPGCRNNAFDTTFPRVCVPDGDAPREAMVVGDSIALSWVPTVEAAGEEAGWVTSAVGYANCSLFDVSATNSSGAPGFRGACEHSRDRMMDVIEKRSPDILFLSASEITLTLTGLSVEDAQAEWQAGVERTLAAVAELPNPPRVYVLGDPPRAGNMAECPTRLGGPGTCERDVSETYLAKLQADRAAVEASTGVRLVETLDWFCADGRCPAFVGEHVIRTDMSHLTDAEARALAPLLLEAMRAGAPQSRR